MEYVVSLKIVQHCNLSHENFVCDANHSRFKQQRKIYMYMYAVVVDMYNILCRCPNHL